MSKPATPLTILVKARKLITPKGAWTQNVFARGRTGRSVSIDSPRAVCFCAWGALERVSPEDEFDADIYRACLAALDDAADGSILLFNDENGRKQKEVLAIYDMAITRLRCAALIAEERTDGTL